MKLKKVNPGSRAVLSLCLWLYLASAGLLPALELKGSKHDLSVTGPGPTKAPSERQICIFCHTPHGASNDAPLWNRFSSGARYTPYSSTTLKATVGQPTGDSKLCLSCHDGTIALGMVRSRKEPIKFAGGVTTMPEGPANLGTDLSDDHPISFKYDSSLAEHRGELADPDTLTGAVRLDSDGMLQCTTCHNAHDNQYGNFLTIKNYASALCINCHIKDYWLNSSHKTSTATWSGTGRNPWPHEQGNTVAANACANCHTMHTAGSSQRLLIHAEEEQNCFACHGGNVAQYNIEREFSKASRHNVVDYLEVHDPVENINSSPRHVECYDCHNPHAVKSDTAEAPFAPGVLAGVRGIDREGKEVAEITYEYELCYRCHADSVDRGESHVNRVFSETNVRNEFGAVSVSSHPVEERGRNNNVPSLIDPLDESSMIYCSDCHGSDRGVNDNSPAGPHGSKWSPILAYRLETSDFSREDAASYALCYNCHSRQSILSDDSFPYHSLHVSDEKTACTTCHDPHGSTRLTHLINFNTDYVSPFGGEIIYDDTGEQTGSCTLTCHGKDHDAEPYEP